MARAALPPGFSVRGGCRYVSVLPSPLSLGGRLGPPVGVVGGRAGACLVPRWGLRRSPAPPRRRPPPPPASLSVLGLVCGRAPPRRRFGGFLPQGWGFPTFSPKS